MTEKTPVVVEVERTRLTSPLIEKICNANPFNVRISKVVAEDSILIRSKTFAAVEVVSCKFKGALTFIDCKFSGNVVLKELNVDGPLSFINCEFGGELTMFNTTVTASICLIRSRISSRLTIDGTSTDKLDLQSVTALEFSVAAQEVAAHIKCLSLDCISFSGGLRVDSVAGIESLNINKCSTSVLVIRHAGLLANAALNIAASKIDEIIFDDIKLINDVKLQITSTLGENVYLRSCVLDRSKLFFKDVVAHGLFSIKHCNYFESVLDISAVNCTNLDLDESLLEFINSRSQKGSAIFPPSMSDENKLQTLKLLKDKFAREHHFDLEDDVFYILKNLEARIKIRNLEWWKKPTIYIFYFLNRWIMGWGVRLRNPLTSTSLMIVLCALVYYRTLDLHDVGMSIKYLGQMLDGFYGATIFSLLAFFGQHADAEISGNAPIALALGEFILGVTMTTIIVGILIRKLVR